MSAQFQNYRTATRDVQWGTSQTENLTVEQINAGSLLRIADATELMAKNHAALVDERDRYLRWYTQEVANGKRLHATIRGLRGTITRMKKEGT